MAEFYKDTDGQWRWRVKASNYEIVADCAEGYSSKAKCIKGFNAMVTAVLGILADNPQKWVK